MSGYFDQGYFDTGYFDTGVSAPEVVEVTRGGYPPKKRKSSWEYSWEREERAAREAYERLRKVEPAAEPLAPPVVEPEAPLFDPAALSQLGAALDAFAAQYKKRQVRRAVAAYRTQLAQYEAALAGVRADMEAQAAELAAAEAYRAAIARDDEVILIAYAERRRQIAAAAVQLAQARYGETMH